MNTTQHIQQAAEELQPLYSQEDADLADRPLWQHPEIDQVTESLRILSDVLFPGRYIPEPNDFQHFFIQQLENVAEILQEEIEKALPFRWMGAADLHENRPPIENLQKVSIEIINQFMSTIPGIRKLLVEDVKAA